MDVRQTRTSEQGSPKGENYKFKTITKKNEEQKIKKDDRQESNKLHNKTKSYKRKSKKNAIQNKIRNDKM